MTQKLTLFFIDQSELEITLDSPYLSYRCEYDPKTRCLLISGKRYEIPEIKKDDTRKLVYIECGREFRRSSTWRYEVINSSGFIDQIKTLWLWG